MLGHAGIETTQRHGQLGGEAVRRDAERVRCRFNRGECDSRVGLIWGAGQWMSISAVPYLLGWLIFSIVEASGGKTHPSVDEPS